nr:hypothetical protein [Campylobacter sp. RM9328]
MFSSEEFIFWANINTTNHVVTSEEISFSRAMVLKYKGDLKFLCEIDETLDNNSTVIEFLNLHKDKIFNCFSLQRVDVKSEFRKRNNDITQTSNFKIPPIRFIIEFKPKSAIIGVFKSEEDR